MTTFSELGISDSFKKRLTELNIIKPTEIQEKAIPVLLGKKGTDFIGQAQTGTGKTAAYGLPLLQKVNPENEKIQALILCPTRELGQQIAKQLFHFTKYGTQVFVEAVYGGAYIGDQIKALQRPTQIVVATPGRLIDLLEKKAIDLRQVKTIVLDEADEMLSMGFKDDIDAILKETNGHRNTWLFSATMPKGIQDIIRNYMSEKAVSVQVDKRNIVNKDIEHQYVICDPNDKVNVLLQFLKVEAENSGIIFCKTKVGAQTLAKQLAGKNFLADAIHGDLLQIERDKVMRAFKSKKLQILVATDMAARGIDVDDLSYVVHFNLPEQIEYYTHRSGRTARAGKKGLSLSIVTHTEVPKLKAIEATLKITFEKIR